MVKEHGFYVYFDTLRYRIANPSKKILQNNA